MDLDLPLDFEGPTRRVVQFALSSMIAPVLLLDGGGLVEQASPAALADLRLRPDLVTGMSVERVIGVSVPELVSVADAASFRLSTIGATTLGWRATSLEDSRVDGGWLVEFQVEAMPPHESDPAARHARLEELLEDLTDRFESLDRYLGLISHDLQAPTRRLLSFIELLRDDLETGTDPGERIAAIESGARYLLDLTTKLLQFCRLGNRPLVLESVDAQRELDRTLDQLSVTLADAGVRVVVDRPLPAVTASPTLLGVVFQNLLENAVQFRRDDVSSEVRVSWRAAGDDVRIDVADNGRGVAEDERVAIFRPFRRLAPGDQGKTGVGLATVRDLVDRFGGTILVSESAIGEGTTFTLTLPAG